MVQHHKFQPLPSRDIDIVMLALAAKYDCQKQIQEYRQTDEQSNHSGLHSRNVNQVII